MRVSGWTVESYRSEMQRTDSLLLTGSIKAEIIGFIVLRQTTLNEAEIYNISVKKRLQSQGIGNFLLREAVNPAQAKSSIEIIWLEVRESNHAAIEFYKRKAFIIIGSRKNFYVNPVENAILMRLDI